MLAKLFVCLIVLLEMEGPIPHILYKLRIISTWLAGTQSKRSAGLISEFDWRSVALISMRIDDREMFSSDSPVVWGTNICVIFLLDQPQDFFVHVLMQSPK